MGFSGVERLSSDEINTRYFTNRSDKLESSRRLRTVDQRLYLLSFPSAAAKQHEGDQRDVASTWVRPEAPDGPGIIDREP